MDGGTTNLVAARIIPERLSTTVATQYPAIAGSLSAILDLEPETGADDDYAKVGREPALRKLGGLVTGRPPVFRNSDRASVPGYRDPDAFVGTNPTGEPITSGLPVTRAQSSTRIAW